MKGHGNRIDHRSHEGMIAALQLQRGDDWSCPKDKMLAKHFSLMYPSTDARDTFPSQG